MSHYSDDPRSVRVDFFKENGKWYCTEAVKWTSVYHSEDRVNGKMVLLHNAFAKALRDHLWTEQGATGTELGRYRLKGMVAVCLQPYHEREVPLMMRVDIAVSMEYP